MNTKSIHKLGDDQFNVQSTQAARMYLVKLGTQSCDCPDWPRVQLCKHVTAIAHFFGNGDQKIELDIPKTVQAQSNWEGSVGACSEVSATSILENVIAVSRALLSNGTLSSLETIQSLQMVESHLTTIVQNACSSEAPLPDKDAIPPNQGTWSETTE